MKKNLVVGSVILAGVIAGLTITRKVIIARKNK